MREIKFRGKNLYDDYIRVNKDSYELTKIEAGQMWIYGGYVEMDGDGLIFPEGKSHFGHGDYWTDDDVPDIPVVDKNTVGQYTGLKDKNGREIYEGDVVRQYYRDNDGGIGLVVFAEDKAKFGIRFFYKSGEAKCLLSIPGYMELMYDESCRTVEVIGNIHDNPELLKQE